jgi:hypothetical protein
MRRGEAAAGSIAAAAVGGFGGPKPGRPGLLNPFARLFRRRPGRMA